MTKHPSTMPPRNPTFDIWPRTEIPKMQRRSRYLRGHLAKLVEKGGTSSHSGLGTTLRYMIEGLEDARCPYNLTAIPGRGYFIEVKKPEERPKWE